MIFERTGLHYRTGLPVRVRVRGGRIAEIRPVRSGTRSWIAPGLVDLQINGFKGNDFNAPDVTPEIVDRATLALRAEGVTSYFPTVISNSDRSIERSMRAIARAREAGVAGIHLEGPFISAREGARGAHDPAFLRAPDEAVFRRWQEAAEGKIRIITLSPEWPGSVPFIRERVREGVTVSIGHTAATPEQIRAAVAAGARLSTHLGNGCPLQLPRHPNVLWEQLSQDALWASVIADGFHLPDSVLKVILNVKGPRAFLVSDAVALAGKRPGLYRVPVGGRVVLTRLGRLHLAGKPGYLAGSAQLLAPAIDHLVASGLCPLGEAWDLASTRPARFMGLPSRRGLSPGAPADFVLFERSAKGIRIRETILKGKPV